MSQTKRNPRRRSSSSFPCLLVLLAAGGMGVFALAAAIMYAPIYARNAFGAPSPDLDLTQRFYFSALLILNENDLRQPNDPAGAARPFQVTLGESPSAIARQLEKEGLIRNADAFTTFLIYSGLDTTLQAGNYTLSPAMTPVVIAYTMQDATPAIVDFHVLAGWRLEEIAASLPTSGLNIDTGTFERIARSHPAGFAFLDDIPPQASLEGFLFPDTYELERTINATTLVNTMLENFQTKVEPDLIQGLANQGLTLYQGVTLASLIQREAVIDEEMPMIASVFLNRLAADMRLDSDPTVQYALGYNKEQETWWTNPLSQVDMQVTSSYNTYTNKGLPPGPISNPSLTALRAVAFPSQTSYYFFRAACDGSGRHNFSVTLEEHVSHACP